MASPILVVGAARSGCGNLSSAAMASRFTKLAGRRTLFAKLDLLCDFDKNIRATYENYQVHLIHDMFLYQLKFGMLDPYHVG